MRKNIFKKKFVVGLVIILLGMSVVPGVSGDWWPMFGHDLGHSRYSTSSGPNTNYTWIFTTDGEVESSPTVVDDRVYIGSWDNKVYCLNASTGIKIWNYTTGNDVGSSPAVVDGKVYIGSLDNKIYCLNADTGTKIWENLTGGYVHSSPAIYNDSVYIGSSDNKTYCLNASNGYELWNHSTGGAVDSSPAVVAGKVYVGSNDTNIYCFYAENGTLDWNYSTNGSIISSPAVVDGKVYIGAKNWMVYCLDADDGSLIWENSTDGIVLSSPAVANGRVYIGSNDGKLYCFDADTGTPLWTYTTSDSINWSSPAIADGKVYISSSDGKLYCFDADTNDHIWNYTTGDLGWSSPTVVDGEVYVGSENGNVYCFGNLPPVFGTPSPTNGSTGNPVSLTWNIPINDFEEDSFNWTIECSNGQSNSGYGESNGTKSLSLYGLMYLTTYSVWVNATDPTGSGQYTRSSYIFTTIANQSPVFGTPTPINGSTNQPLSLTWSISINDSEGDVFNWTIECSNSQSNTTSGATNGTKSLTLSGLSYNSIYTIWVNATDTNGSGLYTREWYQFTTIVSQKPVFGTPSPSNGSTNQSFSFTWSISINDLEGDSFDWTIECSNGQSANASGASNDTKSLSLSGLMNLTTYNVWVNATDPGGSGLYTREWYQFTTIVSQKPVFGTPSPANGSTNQPLSLTWSIPINDPEGDFFNWTIECSNGQNNSAINASNGTKTLTLSGLSYLTNYFVWVNATDSYNSSTSAWFSFYTKKYSSGGGGGGGTTPTNNAPVADVNGPYNGILETPISFDGSGSTDSDGTISSYAWIFGDGATGSGVSITHSYTAVGNYTVKLTVTDNGGLKDSDTTYALITDKPNTPPGKPTINGNLTGKKNTNYNYTVVSIDEDNDALKYIFDWDDGTSITVTDFVPNNMVYNMAHSWANSGVYTIKISAIDEHNYTSETKELMVLIDAVFCDNIGYITDADSNGIYELFHSNTTGNETNLMVQNGKYLIDSNSDGKWDYTFDLTSGLSAYQEETKDETPGFELVFFICAIVVLILFWKRKNSDLE